MGDTLRTQNIRPGGADTQMKHTAPHQDQQPQPASDQPRSIEHSAPPQAKQSTKNQQKDNSMRLEVGNYSNLPQNFNSRQNSQAFLFNPGRQDSFSSILNSYPPHHLTNHPTYTQPRPPQAHSNSANPEQDPAINSANASALNNSRKFPSHLDTAAPSYYMSHRDSMASVPQQVPETIPPSRLRGDSIFLPPPVTTKYPSEELKYQPQPPQPGPSRSNSIFNSVIQYPNSNSNSVSDASNQRRQQSRAPQGPEDYFQQYDALNKDSFGQLFAWNQLPNSQTSPQPIPPNSHPGQDSQPNSAYQSRRQTLRQPYDNPNAFLENSGFMGSMSGVSNDNINAFLSSLNGKGSIDFSNMSNEQRRHSILKFINDQQSGSNDPRRTALREDIFESQPQSNPAGVPMSDSRSSNLSVPEQSHVSKSSSLSSKSSNRYNDEPQSPKTSPSQFNQNIHVQNGLSLQQQHQLQHQHQQQYPRTANPAAVQKQPPYYTNIRPQQGNYPYAQYPNAMGNVPKQQTPQQVAPSQISPKVTGSPYQYQQSPQQRRQQPPGQQQRQQRQRQQPQQKQQQARQGQRVQQSPQIRQQQQSPLVHQQMPPQQRANQGYQIHNPQDPYASQLMRQQTAGQYGAPDNKQFAYPSVSPAQTNNYHPQGPPPDKNLLPAQQFARSEDGRPLLGATKVDQLMLVIQAREKGNKGAISQAPDGSILASPNSNDDKSAVIPSTVDLVGGIEKPAKDDENGSSGQSPERKKKRRGKSQQCPYCFKQFNQSTHLEVHVRSHIGYKPFQCTYCNKRFTQGGNLRTHMRLHTGEKPFQCEVCNRQFSRKGNLAAHMLTHNKEKPFECKLDDCDKSFTQLGNLKSHQNKFHLPSLNRLTHTLAELSGEAIKNLPPKERELLDYFAKLYKNSNKGIRGRGRGKKAGEGGDDGLSGASSAQSSPQQLTMQKPMNMSPQQGSPLINQGMPTNQGAGPDGYGSL